MVAHSWFMDVFFEIFNLGFLVRLYFLSGKYLEKSDVVCANATFCPHRMLF